MSGPLSPDELEDFLNPNRGGWNEPPYHGWTADGQEITFVTGWGRLQGETLIADGHLSDVEELWTHPAKRHYYNNEAPQCLYERPGK